MSGAPAVSALLRFASQDDSFEKGQKRIPALRSAIGRATRPPHPQVSFLFTWL